MTLYKHGADIAEIQKQYQIENITDFSSNVNIFLPPKLEELIRQFPIEKLAKYPDIHYTELRAKLAEKYSLRAEHIIVGNGSTELIFLLAKLPFVQKIGILSPTFGEYRRAAQIGDKEIVDFYYEKDFSIDCNRIASEKVDALFVCNPNNPSGNINHLMSLLEKTKKSGTLLIVDETFMDFSSDKSCSLLPLVSEYDNLFVLKAVTKFYAMTGLRLGYGFASASLIESMWAIKEPWSVNAFAEVLIDAIFDEDFESRTVSYYKEEIAWMKKELEKIKGIFVYPSDSNYFLIQLPPHISSGILKERMIVNHRILIRDCSNYSGLDEFHIRVNIKERNKNEMLIRALEKEIH